MAKEYKIRIENDVKLQETSTGSPTQRPKTPKETQQELSSSVKRDNNVSKVIATQMGKQALNYASSNYGNLTGDYITQANIQGTIELVGLGIMAAQFPVGTVAAVGALAVKAINKSVEIEKKNREVELLRQRTGMMTYSGGRL